MKKGKTIGLSLNKKTISKFTANYLSGGSSQHTNDSCHSEIATSCMCTMAQAGCGPAPGPSPGGGGGGDHTQGSWCKCK